MLDALRAPANGIAQTTRPPVAASVPATMPLRPAAGTAVLTAPAPMQQPRRRARARVRRRRLALAVVGLLALGTAGVLLFEQDAQPTAPTSAVATHHVTSPQTRALTRPSTTPTTDAEGSAISALATSLADGGFPGDGALVSALQATAAQPVGAGREAAAQQTLSLAGVLLDGGGITSGQYQDVVTVLEPTGATVTTTTSPAPPQPFQAPIFGGHGHGGGHGDGGGSQG
jgi:hypothetical protein